MDQKTLGQYYADSPPAVVQLAIKSHWNVLTDRQKLYAHHVSRASFNGTRIILRQVSPESEPIFDFILTLYRVCHGDWHKLQQNTGISAEEMKYFLEYAAQFLGNVGNYKGFGDSKFVPRCSYETVNKLASVSPDATRFFEKSRATGAGLFADVEKPDLMHLGFPDQGHLSTYYPDSSDITQKEIGLIDEFLGKKGLLPENTRLRKTADGDFKVLISSSINQPPPEGSDAGLDTTWDLEGYPEVKTIRLHFGDHMEQMEKISFHIEKAGNHVANDLQKHMVEAYATSFRTGSLIAFKESQKIWVKDRGPQVESNLGFIETYRDPAGVRGEWEGMVAMVNNERTESFRRLVDAAPDLIPKLPWSKDFEKDRFIAPDFTSLEVLSFASSGIPAGINIPNYEDVRQQVGFKNVSLGNVLNVNLPDEKLPFIRPEDDSTYRNNLDQAFEVQVGIHELLGHGTGKLLQETSTGKYNFDIQNPPISPISKEPCSTYYKPSQTWSSVFGSISSSYEECRAECVAMVFCCDFNVLKIFGFGDGTTNMDNKAGDILYASYLSMARAGVIALEYWDPKSKKWGQAHMQARFAILQTLLAAGPDFLKLDYSRDDLSDLTIKLDRHKIISHGRPAVEVFLQKLHIYKCTADISNGKSLYEQTTSVDDHFWGTLIRDQVLKNKQPRKIFVQANTFENNGQVTLKEYEPTTSGMIQSFAERDV